MSLVFFIGSGMSKNVGLPDWGELIDELKKDLNTTEEDYLKIAQLYFLEFGEYEYIKKVKSFFPSENIVIQNTHSLLVKLFPQNIITTNWDIVIEKAIDNEMALYDVYTATICQDKKSIIRYSHLTSNPTQHF